MAKTLGFGVYPDWRWRCAMKYVKRIGHTATPAEYFAGPEEKALLADETLATIVFPYLKQRLHPDAGHEMPASEMNAMALTLDAANEEYVTPHCYTLNLEAGVLGRRPMGDLLADPEELTPGAQILYERLFFDVRPFLNDTAALCHVLFHDRERIYRRGGFDLLCKVTAYGLGFAEYQQWLGSGRVKKAHAFLNDVFRYMNGLELLKADTPDDMERVLLRFFRALPEIIAQSEGDVHAGRPYRRYTSGEMAAVSEAISRAE